MATSETKRVLIVGGGIAGMALAIVLQRAGIAADIAEIDKDWRVYGAGITITVERDGEFRTVSTTRQPVELQPPTNTPPASLR